MLGSNSNPIAIDNGTEKLELAKKIGADYAINSKESQDIQLSS
jgi:D-arabinose 1-dehydrogenase-like Zn-dependent alcohol dehydrogenase